MRNAGSRPHTESTRAFSAWAFVALQAGCLLCVNLRGQPPDDAHLSVDRSQVTLGESVALSWSVPPDVKNVYFSSLDAGTPQPTGVRNGVIQLVPSSSRDVMLLAETPAGVLVRTAHISVSGVRGTATQLDPHELSCNVSLTANAAQPLSLVDRVKEALQRSAFAVDQEFIRGTADLVLQTKPGPQKSPATAGTVRQVIYQVALGLNLVGSSSGSGSVMGIQLGSQMRFRRLQEAQWQVDTDGARCLEEAKSVEQPLRDLLRH